MPLISTLCLRVLIVGTEGSFFKRTPGPRSLRTWAAVYVLKRCARRVEVTTNIACETVAPNERVLRECATRLCASVPKIDR